MDTESLIEAVVVESETMSDSALRVLLAMDRTLADRAFELFGSRGTELALARLDDPETLINGMSGKFKTPKTGPAQLIVEINSAALRAAYKVCGKPETKLLLAALKPEYIRQREAEAEQRKQQRMETRGGSKAALAAQWCNDPQFQQWLAVTYPKGWSSAVEQRPDGSRSDLAAQVVRAYCWINSRAELDQDDNAWRRFNEHFRQPFMERKDGQR